MRSLGVLLSFAVLCAALGACKGQDHAGGPPPAAPAADSRGETQTAAATSATLQTADQVFSTRCATCHGTSGHGNGPAAQALKPKPRDYSDAAWQKSVTDEQIKKTIIEGGAAVGKSSLMAPNADLADKPAILDALVEIIRGFGKDAASPSAGSP
jgi:mono/diheme cytochrome c family protein